MEIVVAADPAAVADEAARWIARRVRSAVRLRGRADVAFSGGSTPALMIAQLGALPLPWAAVHVWQVDERVAPAGDPDRNAGLLDGLPVPRSGRHLMGVTAKDQGAAARRYAAALPAALDVVHLGLGDDGHTASWPPGDAVLDSAASVGLSGPYRGRVRMTLTPVAVNAARARLVVVTGAAKASVISQWFLDDPSLPIQRLRRAGTIVVLDTAAAARLSPMPNG